MKAPGLDCESRRRISPQVLKHLNQDMSYGVVCYQMLLENSLEESHSLASSLDGVSYF